MPATGRPADATSVGPWLGIDVGTVRVGVAICDPALVLATPVRTLSRDLAGGQDRHDIARIAREAGVTLVVVGLPRSLSGDLGAAAQHATSYAGDLAAELDCPVRMVDERWTTVDAANRLHQAGRASRSHKQVIDQAAAVLILQSALDARSRTGVLPGSRIRPRRVRGRTRAPGTPDHE